METRDSNGAVLAEGDSVTIIKDLKVKVASALSVVASGPDSMVVCGGWPATMSHSRSSHCSWTFPARSVACTAKTCVPSARPV